jgi:glycosyltransferase involved in cell wall biosynthesis
VYYSYGIIRGYFSKEVLRRLLSDIPAFNYIITIHNKEALLERVLAGVANCCGAHSRIIPVLDGCTDGSEAIARKFAETSGLDVKLVFAPDVHEIKSINLGLKEAKPGYVVLIQDDVIVQEPKLEELVHALCDRHERRLGYLSFRLAADVRFKNFPRRVRLAARLRDKDGLLPQVEDYRFVGLPGEVIKSEPIDYYQFVPRMVGIKSPVCLTPELRQAEPFLDEEFAPYCYDDFDLSLRSLKLGLKNGLYPIHFHSDLEWGGTRKDPKFRSEGALVMLRNRHTLWRKHGDFIRNRGKGKPQIEGNPVKASSTLHA